MIPVTISRDADVDLDGILDHSIAAHGRTVAEAYLRMIHPAFDRLSGYPELGAVRSDLSTVCKACPAADTAFSIFSEAESVLIARVLHKAMDPARHL